MYEKLMGRKVIMIEPHPKAGVIGTVIDVEMPIDMYGAMIESEDGELFYVFNPDHMKHA